MGLKGRDITDIDLLEALRAMGRCRTRDIAGKVGLSHELARKRLRFLEKAGFVTKHKDHALRTTSVIYRWEAN